LLRKVENCGGQPATILPNERGSKREGTSWPECWLDMEAPRVVAVVEAESINAFGQIRMDWGDMFEIVVFPAVTGEQGMDMARQAMSGQQATAGQR
jgi:hypothetical protein